VSRRVAIIGAGIIGLSAAYFLVRRGTDVVVIDYRDAGQGASRGNGGWITPSMSGPVPGPGLLGQSIRWMVKPDSPLYIRPTLNPSDLAWLWSFWRHCNRPAYKRGLLAMAALNRGTIDLYRSLSRQLGFDFTTNGITLVCSTPDEVRQTLDEFAGLEELGLVAARAVKADHILALAEPIKVPAGGVYLDGDGMIDPIAVTGALARFLRASGVAFLIGEAVTGFSTSGSDRVTAVTTAASSVTADDVLIAAGAWTGKVTQDLGFGLPLRGGRGYSFEASIEGLRLKAPLYFHKDRVGLTPLPGRVRAVGTMELDGFDEVVRAERLRPMKAAVRSWFPRSHVQFIPGTEWAGLRAMTPDGLPVLGRLPGWSNVYVATGHSMLGMTLGPASGDAIAELIVTGNSPDHMKSFDPARFART
jgi:D-amino-acid dehydrogenase